jgi:subtilisin-like proprotein convertase family protein
MFTVSEHEAQYLGTVDLSPPTLGIRNVERRGNKRDSLTRIIFDNFSRDGKGLQA